MAGASCAGGANLKRRIEDIVAGQANLRVSWKQKLLLAIDAAWTVQFYNCCSKN